MVWFHRLCIAYLPLIFLLLSRGTFRRPVLRFSISSAGHLKGLSMWSVFIQTLEESITASFIPPFSPPLSLPRFIACTGAGFYPQTHIIHVILIEMQAWYQSALHFSLIHLLPGKKDREPEQRALACWWRSSPGKSSSRVRSLWVPRHMHCKGQICS